ncbi:MFS transporter [Thermoleophilia bacterium SCSIO 60948]|nr:MFS transporter [Thermoleophilia bacterium SCSIO 60948]
MIERRRLAVLAGAHASADLCQGALAALIPFLIAGRGISYGQAGLLLMVMAVASSVLQPLFGVASDRWRSPATVPLALLVAGAGITAVGLVDSVGGMVAGVAVAGLGVGAFHPDAARRARLAGAARPSSALSVFAFGGNAGFAAAPALITPAVLIAGLAGAAIVLVPIAIAIALMWASGELSPPAGGGREPVAATGGDRWAPFAGVATIATLRSGTYFGLQAFLATYLIATLGATEAQGNLALTVMLVVGAAGTLAGGVLADRFERRFVMASFSAAAALATALLALAPTIGLATIASALVGFCLFGNFSLSVAWGQELLPSRPGFATGVTLGLAMGIGGAFAAGFGAVADLVGIEAVFWALAALPLPGALIATLLPRGAEPGPGTESAGGRAATVGDSL